MKKLPLFWLLVLCLVGLAGCSEQTPPPAPSQSPAATNATTAFEARGVIRALPEGGQTLVVRHDEIPGYMPKMTMELNVRDTNELRGLVLDDEITFRLIATADTHWIENIQRVGHVASAPELPKTNRIIIELRPGDLLPDAAMTAEDGRTIHFSDFRGQAVAFTFIFTRCPLPDFCPRMGGNFARTRELLRAGTNAPANWQLLSLSFDPEFDQPAVLASYARSYRGSDTNRWLFAAATPELLETLAPQLDFMFARDAGGFSHNLRTVVLDPQGRIARQFDGNRWTPEELADAVIQAARP
jgi:protein SCO1